MPSSPSASEIYGVVPLAYQDPDFCQELPDVAADSNQARTLIPRRPGAGILHTRSGKGRHANVTMLNGRVLRERGEEPQLDAHGFAYAKMSGVPDIADWNDVDEVRDRYLPVVEALVRQRVPGANLPGAHVLIFDHAVRQRPKDGGGWMGYALNPHTDATIRSIHSRAKDQVLGTNETVTKYRGTYPACWGEVRPTREWQRKLFRAETEDHDSPDGEGGEHLIVNVWRPLSKVRNYGLAAVDGRTIAQADVHPTVLQEFDNTPGGRSGGKIAGASQVVDVDGRPVLVRRGETTVPLHDPAHRWIYFPEMEPDEALLLKVHDSRRDGRTRHGLHTAFKDPNYEKSEWRESIETRCLVILPPGADVGTASRL